MNQLACQANDAIMQQMVSNGGGYLKKRKSLVHQCGGGTPPKSGPLEWVQSGDAVIILIYEDGSHRVLVDREGP